MYSAERIVDRVVRAGLVAAGILLFVLGLGGCKSTRAEKDEAPGAAGGEASTPTPAVDPEMLAYAQRQVDLAYKGTDRALPASAPKPQPGKVVWIISPGQIGESASIPTNAAKEAGEAVGWKMTLFDGQLDPSRFVAGVRQAIAAKADGIILDAIDC